MDSLPIRLGAEGDAVRDLQQRLAAMGLDTAVESRGLFGPTTEQAVRAFQSRRGLPQSGTCDLATWTALVEAGYRLGDRLLYLRSPMLRGDDVAELQRLLGMLGFDAGRVDGILGHHTEGALHDFQRNAGLTTDGVCGREVLLSLDRLGQSPGRSTNVAGVREREFLRSQPPVLSGRRIVVGEAGGLDAVVRAIDRGLQDAGAIVAVLHHPHPSVQAVEANDFQADLYLGLGLSDESTCEASYYATTGFESAGGRRLAELLTASFERIEGMTTGPAQGRWLPILRETRMPAVVVALGPAPLVVERTADLAEAAHDAMARWCASPFEP
jgi:N-acetylmuramoyl-L-alanine amidase